MARRYHARASGGSGATRLLGPCSLRATVTVGVTANDGETTMVYTVEVAAP